MSGRSRVTWRSKRPVRRSPGYGTSGRLVAAITITWVLVSKPSISTSSWFSVCSRSSWPPPRPAPRWRPTAAISSTKTMQGLFFLAWSKRSRTRLAPTPTNISTNSDPEMLKKGTPPSPATALLISVFEELDPLGQLLLGLLHPGHVDEGHLRLVAGDHPGPAAPEGHRLVLATLALAKEVVDEAPDQQQQDQVGKQGNQQAGTVGRLEGEGDVVLVELLLQEGGAGAGVWQLDVVLAPILRGRRGGRALDLDPAHLVLVGLGQEGGVVPGVSVGAVLHGLPAEPEHDPQHSNQPEIKEAGAADTAQLVWVLLPKQHSVPRWVGRAHIPVARSAPRE